MDLTEAPIFGPTDELALEQGCVYHEPSAARVRKFIETFCRHSKGRWAGTPFHLLPWQWDFVRRLYGWKRPDGTRRYRKAYLEVPKKNGKSMLVSALALYHLLADGEACPEVYINACDRAQAGIVYGEAARMVIRSGELSRRLETIPSQKRVTFKNGMGDGFVVANSNEVASKDGINSSLTLFDELHRQPNHDMWRIFRHAGVAREQPLLLAITTAGEDLESVCYEEHEYSLRINKGDVPDTEHLGVIYAADPADDVDDQATWFKANPSLGHTLKLAEFAAALGEARQMPTEFANFQRLRLNIWVKCEQLFISEEAWRACGSEPIKPEERLGEPCWMGVDLASTTDLTALVTLLGDQEKGVDVLARFWMPEERVDELSRRDRVPYRHWIKLGLIESTPGAIIDYEAVRREVLHQAGLFDLRKLLIDPYNAKQFASQLLENDGLPVAELRQGYLSLSDPTKQLERLILGKQLRHGNNPVMRWMASNAICTKDAAGNVKLDKAKSRQKIDGMAALVNAVAAFGDDSEERSVYEDRGVLIF